MKTILANKEQQQKKAVKRMHYISLTSAILIAIALFVWVIFVINGLAVIIFS